MADKRYPVVQAIERNRVWVYFETSGKWSMDRSAFPNDLKVGDRIDIKVLPRDEGPLQRGGNGRR